MIAYNDSNHLIELGGKTISMYGVCETPASTAVKVVSNPDLGSIRKGTTLRVKFVYDNTASNPSLNVNNIRAVPIYSRGTTMGSSWQAGSVVQLTFDNDAWMLEGVSGGLPEDPLTAVHGGTGNTEGYIRAGQKAGTIVGAHATIEGFGNTAGGENAHAEGEHVVASITAAHAEGSHSTASGIGSHAEGSYYINFDSGLPVGTTASAEAAHAEGLGTIASGNASHAEGCATAARGDYSHASGANTIAGYSYQTVVGKMNDNKETTLFEVGNGTNLEDRRNAFEVYDSEGISTDNGNTKIRFGKDANDMYGYYKGDDTTLNLFGSGGGGTNNYNDLSNLPQVNGITLQGNKTSSALGIPDVTGNPSGTGTASLEKLKIGSTIYNVNTGSGMPSDPLTIDHGGTGNTAGYIRTGIKSGTSAGNKATIEGYNNTATGAYAHAEGSSNTSYGSEDHFEGYGNYYVSDVAQSSNKPSYNHAEGKNNQFMVATSSHAEGEGCTIGSYDGNNTNYGECCHAEGYDCWAHGDALDAGIARGKGSNHAEGWHTTASRCGAHSEGCYTYANGKGAHAEGEGTYSDRTTASGEAAHAEGYCTISSGQGSHSEGWSTEASEYGTHAEGLRTKATNSVCHAQGDETVADGYASHAMGINTHAGGQASLVGGQYVDCGSSSNCIVFGKGKDRNNYAQVSNSGGFTMVFSGVPKFSSGSATEKGEQTCFSVNPTISTYGGDVSYGKTFCSASNSTTNVTFDLPIQSLYIVNTAQYANNGNLLSAGAYYVLGAGISSGTCTIIPLGTTGTPLALTPESSNKISVSNGSSGTNDLIVFTRLS